MMRRKRLLWQLFPSYLLITIVSLLAVTWYASWYFHKFYLQQTALELEARARLVERLFADSIITSTPAEIDALCKAQSVGIHTRITVIDPHGTVLGDSEEPTANMDNHAARPEVMAALAGDVGKSTRYSRTLLQNMMYVATPVTAQGRVIAVVRTAIPITSIEHALRTLYGKILLGGLLIALLAAGISLVVSRRISHPLEEIRRGAERFAQGDLGTRLPVPSSEEIGALAEAMNQMAVQLDERIRTALRQRNEQEAVLFSMIEGVLAVDNDGRILKLNQTAADILALDPDHARGRDIREVIRNTDLQQFIAQVLATHEPQEVEIALRDGRERLMQAHGTILRDEEESGIGALVVLNDVTKLRRLEAVRRDFVANVSHELRTPITSIKGFVETLQDGAIDGPDARRFLDIISKHADRLNAIIEDLLSLSHLEQEADATQLSRESCPIAVLLQSAILACEVKRTEKRIALELTCPPEITASINAPLIEQAVINLIDNAIKYSEPESTVDVSAERDGGTVVIAVRDHGCGISREHLPRLFERFYRVDKGRSRKLGGTGLGLAIVKHIAQAHGGYVTVESAPGKGSTFFLHL